MGIKINNERIFVVDICKAEKCQHVAVGTKDSEFGCISFEERVSEKNVVCIQVGCCYVPIEYIDGFLSYAEIMSHEVGKGKTTGLDSRFMDYLPNASGYYVKNVHKAFDNKGKTSLETLKAMNLFVKSNVSEDSQEVEAERE